MQRMPSIGGLISTNQPPVCCVSKREVPSFNGGFIHADSLFSENMYTGVLLPLTRHRVGFPGQPENITSNECQHEILVEISGQLILNHLRMTDMMVSRWRLNSMDACLCISLWCRCHIRAIGAPRPSASCMAARCCRWDKYGNNSFVSRTTCRVSQLYLKAKMMSCSVRHGLTTIPPAELMNLVAALMLISCPTWSCACCRRRRRRSRTRSSGRWRSAPPPPRARSPTSTPGRSPWTSSRSRLPG
mmetsp:Transcript_77159/g.236075  ORF Transcript_77159/g.236075 Transcript_77159/m.236075 type:complete len:245 (+) Transcript_77159:1481-2215(+)